MEVTAAAENQLPWRQASEGLLGLPYLSRNSLILYTPYRLSQWRSVLDADQ